MAERDYLDLTAAGRVRRLRRVAIEALDAYDLDIVSMRGLPDATNGVFRLRAADGAGYAMRVGLGPPLGHTVDETRSELAFVDAMARNADVSVPVPVASRTGAHITMASARGVPGERPCVVFTWASGSLLADRLDAGGMEALGTATARLHRASASFRAPSWFSAPFYTSVYPYDAPFVVFAEVGTDLLPKRRRAVFAEGSERLAAAFATVGAREAQIVIHGDLHQWNCKVDRGRITILDFEDLLWGWPVQDLAITLYYSWPDRFDLHMAQLRRGYERVAAWPDGGGLIEAFVIARSLLMANDVVTQPEWLHAAPEVFARAEQRIADMLRRLV